jgi:hypothetical protein
MAIDLLQFCDATYPPFAVPFVVNQKRYATDSRIAVEVDAVGEPDFVTTGNKYQDPPKSITKIFAQFNNVAAAGSWPEPDTITGPARQRVCGLEVAIKYDQIIRNLPGPVTCAKRDENSIQFTFDGGRGILMALREPH